MATVIGTSPKKKGTDMISRHRFFWCSVGLVVLTGLWSGCSNTPPVAETEPPPVSVSKPVVRKVVDHDDYEGRIGAVETVEVRARVRGHLIKVNFEEGSVVEKDQPLFEIDPRDYKNALDAAEAQKAGAEASLDLAKKEYARSARLAQTGAASREELDVWLAKQAVATSERLKAIASVEQAQRDLDFTKIAAAITGKISRTQVTVGNLINAGGGDTLLTTITSVDPMYVYFDVDERALLRYRQVFRKGPVKEGSPEPSVKDLKIPVSVGLEGEDGYPHKGVIDFTDNKVNPSTGTIQVRGLLPNPTRILDAGMRARVRVPIGDPHESLMITERAIGTDQARRFVFVVKDDVAERRDVQLDRLVDGLQVIKEGLKKDDLVVVNGIQRVRDGAKVKPNKISMPGAPAEATDEKTKN